MIKTENLAISYDGTKRLEFEDFDLSGHEEALLLGKSGSGKSTLLHLIGGILKPSQGKISIDNSVITDLSEGEMDRFRSEYIGYIFQSPHLVKALTVAQNLKLAQSLSKSTETLDWQELAQILEISEILNSKVNQISTGQAQRVSIARALIARPKLLLADEPTSALDDDNCMVVLKLLRKLSSEYKIQLVIATHDIRLKTEIDHQIVLDK